MPASLSLAFIFFSIHHQLGEIRAEDGGGVVELVGRVFLDTLELVVEAHSLIFVHAEGMVGEQFHTLNLLVVSKMAAEAVQMVVVVGQAGHQYITQPEGVTLALQPSGRFEGAGIAARGDGFMALGVNLFHVEQNEIDGAEKGLDVLVPYRTVGVDTDVETSLFQTLAERHESLGLHGGFATREGHTAAAPEECFHRDHLVVNIVGVGEFALADGVNRVGVGAIEAAERTALQEYDETQTRTVERAHAFITVYAKLFHDFIFI